MTESHAFRAALAIAALVAASASHAQSTQEQELRALLPHLESAAPPADVTRSSCAARLVAYALLYRSDPNRYRDALFGELVIDDYRGRSAGIYKYIDPDQIAPTINSVSTLPSGISDQRLAAAVGFCALKDKNLWVETESGRVSVARVLRGMALGPLLQGTDEDPLAIVNSIDAHMAAQSSLAP